ncbi:MBL fold metallo-hydrolase [Halobacteriales archaeon QH_10_67_13]|nr:MAG: MBL fold metallo-hydrolase [Halobacteriales archaeon QH_10_67_13]
MDVHNLTADAEAFTCNAYLAAGEIPTLVDAGTIAGIETRIAERVDGLDRVVLTHQHPDHVEQLEAVVDAFDPEVFAYAEHPLRTDALTDGEAVAIGDEDYEVVSTPGHAEDHVSLVGERAVFSGDVVVYEDGAYDGGSFGRTDIPGASRERLIKSLSDLLDRMPESVDRLYPGHGDSFSGDVHTIVDRALSRAERHEPKYPEE